MDGRHSVGEAYCMGSALKGQEYAAAGAKGCLPPTESWIRDESGKVVGVDITRTDIRRPHVGLWAEVSEGEEFFELHERSGMMTGVSRVPGMNAMSVAHDKFASDYNLNMVETVASIPPAIVLTYAGLGAPTRTPRGQVWFSVISCPILFSMRRICLLCRHKRSRRRMLEATAL